MGLFIRNSPILIQAAGDRLHPRRNPPKPHAHG